MARKKKATFPDVIRSVQVGKTLNQEECSVIINSIYETAAEYVSIHGVKNLLKNIYDQPNEYDITIGDMLDELIHNACVINYEKGRPLSDHECKVYYGLSTTNDHSGKMSAMAGTSTNNKVNELCAAHKCVPGSICQGCFASAQIDYMTSMNKPLTVNYLLLNYDVLPIEILPIINRQFYRIESFGDVGSVNQAANYIHMMQAHDLNKRCIFGAWTKNAMIWQKAFEKYGKPANLSFGFSSLYENVIADAPKGLKLYLDFIFTVWSDQAAADAAGVVINCGKRHCITCLTCYLASMRNNFDEITYVHELKK